MSKKKKVLVAMSGGVDSSFAAACLQKQGLDVVGVHFLLWKPEPEPGAENNIPGPGKSALKSAEQMGIELRVIDLRDRFREKVVDYFVNDYLSGRTPNPCSLCNPEVKFAALLELADQVGAEYVASGHYARVVFDACKSEYQLREADDKSKDQSYFLALLNRNILGRMVLPLGEMKKSDVKTEALKMGLDSANREESQDVCFALSKNYAGVIEALRPDTKISGDMVDVSGKKVGVHKGIHRYTVGQHRGLALNRPDLFVVAIDAVRNQIVVDRENHLYHSKMKVRGMNWLTEINLPVDCRAKIRYRFEKADCRVEQISDGAVAAVFKKPQRAITPGQASVFYLENRVIGGGWIESGWD